MDNRETKSLKTFLGPAKKNLPLAEIMLIIIEAEIMVDEDNEHYLTVSLLRKDYDHLREAFQGVDIEVGKPHKINDLNRDDLCWCNLTKS